MPQFDHGAARADLCRLLSACYYQPAPEFAEEKVFDSILQAASAIDADLAERAHRLRDAFMADDLQNLLIDYTRLFLGPVQALAKPYGSVWLNGQSTLMQESTVAVLALYAEGGFEIDDDFCDLPDHIAAELEFLYLLLFREAQARLQGDADAVKSNAVLRRRLLDDHLGRWVVPFAAAVRSGAECAFYRELAELTERFIAKEAADYAGVSARP